MWSGATNCFTKLRCDVATHRRHASKLICTRRVLLPRGRLEGPAAACCRAGKHGTGMCPSAQSKGFLFFEARWAEAEGACEKLRDASSAAARGNNAWSLCTSSGRHAEGGVPWHLAWMATRPRSRTSWHLTCRSLSVWSLAACSNLA